MDKKNNAAPKENIFQTLWRWTKRMFMGASKELSMDEKLAVEKLESPSVMAVKSFFRRKLAVIALVVLISMFLFVFIGPSIWPMDVNYTDTLQKNLAPNYTFLSVPKELAGNIKTINGFGSYTVGVSQDHNFYIWGNMKDTLSDLDLTKQPEEIRDGNVFTAAAGSNHVIAVTMDGKVVGWGSNRNGQYGEVAEGETQYVQMPDFMLGGKTIDPEKVEQLVCGYQVTGMVYDGGLYVWGNTSGMGNIKELAGKYTEGVKDIAISNYYAIVLMEDGSIKTGGATFSINGQKASSNLRDEKGANLIYKDLGKEMRNHKGVDIAATQNCFAILTDSGEVIVFGAAKYGERDIPSFDGKKIVKIEGGTNHFVALAEDGTVYAWGLGDSGQLGADGETAGHIFTGAKATYLADENGELSGKYGFKGYLMGTDSMGRDVFTRIVHGGKMTMTIGAVAVIVSTIIAIIIGCLAGYFGGWVDMLLMRVTEIFSAIPFLPFAMLLSYVIQTMPISETTRIFIIMVMLGLLSWTGLARMIRAQVLAEREKEFVLAAKSMGIRERAIAFKHILPNVISIILVNVTLDFASCLLTESSLSYLGFGVQQPRPTWGNMLNGANNSLVIQNYWWQWVFPALFLAIATISINIIGDALRDILDPKSDREK